MSFYGMCRSTRMELRKVSFMPRYLAGMLIASSLLTTLSASAEEQGTDTGLPRLGQSPGEPQVRSAPPSIPFGVNPETAKDNVLDFHGYMLLPARVGVLERSNPALDQASTALHSPPLVPGQFRRTFEYTGVIPDPWVQLNLTYGNSVVSATTVLAASGTTDGSGIYNLSDQLGVYDAFLSVNLSKPLKTPIVFRVGAMTGRYGVMGAYDSGRYGKPLMFRTNSVGELITAGFKVGPKTMIAVEQSIGGQIQRVPRNEPPAGWNDFADPNTGSSWVNQLHVGLSQGHWGQIGLHYATAWSQDDQILNGNIPNGRISVFGGDLRFTMGRFGHLYGGVARTEARNAGSVSGVIEILNARGGPELIKYYFQKHPYDIYPASDGSGSLTTFGAQYDVSLARAIYGSLFDGKSPDLILSAFGIATSVKSDQVDGVMKLKAGFEATYSMKSWFGVSGRFDHVSPDTKDASSAFNVFSPRLLFHTDWRSRDEFALQYSYFVNGNSALVYRGSPMAADPTAAPDKHVFMISGTFWW